MRTELGLKLPYDRLHVAGLVPTPARGTRRRPPANRLIEALCNVDLHVLPDVVPQAALLPATRRDELLGIVVDVIGWMLDLADRGVHRVFSADGKIHAEVLDPCLKCEEEAHLTRLPAAYPLFCSDSCLHEWTEENARNLPRLEGLDALLEKTRDEAHDEGVEEAERKTDQKVDDAVEAAMDSDDNPLLDLLRQYGGRLLSLEQALWKLECGLRSGKIVL